MRIVDTLYSLIDRGRKGENIGLKTGIDKMDSYTGGIQKSIYTLVFGLSGSGKTSWVLYSIYRILKDYPTEDIKIVYYSLEMRAEILLGKILCLYIYEEYDYIIPYSNLLSWQDILNDDAYEYVTKSKKWLDSIIDKFIILDKSLTASYFYATFKTLLEKWGEFANIDEGRRKIYIKKNPNQLVIGIIDHLGLAMPSENRSKKEEIDKISQYAVTLRENCQVSWFMLMQENRNSSNMDRRKAEMSESSAEDIKDSGNPYNDCDVCIAVYNPLKHKIKNYRNYQIINESANESNNEFVGLRDRFRSAILIKNRYGISDKVVGLNFFGEIGLFKELPKGDQITDYTPYIDLIRNNIVDQVNNQQYETEDKIEDHNDNKISYIF